MKRILSALCLSVIALNAAYAQSSYVPLNSTYYHTVDRYEILNGKFSETFFTSVKQYTRKSVAEFIDTLAKDSASLKRISKVDRFNFTYLANDNWEFSSTAQNDSKRPILKSIYKKQSDFYHVNTKDFDLHVNPVIYFSGGYEKTNPVLYTSGGAAINHEAVTQNTRGVEVRGMIDKRIGFYTFMTDNQALLPSYVNDYRNQFGVIPGEGYIKSFKNKSNGADYISARGYITFNATRHIAVQFGHDRNFIGNGYRSLILSDNSSSYTFLKVSAKVWKLNYTNLFTQMDAYPKMGKDTVLPKKYMAFHHLSLNVTKHLNIGVFESVVFGRNDSTKNGQFDAAYLNPIIFYRYTEQQLGSGDNAIIGMDFKWNFLRHFSMYGQVILDEFVLDHVKAHDGWWANKQALQGGIKYIDAFGIKNLDLQGEINHVRPFTYSHESNFTNYSNYNQPLAHPLGANFTELIGIARYQPLPRLNISAKLFYTKLGADTANSDWGGNILIDYTKRSKPIPTSDLGNKTGQGVKTALIYTSLTLSYMLRHNVFVDGYVTYRDYNSSINTLDRKSLIGGFSLRWYIPQHLNEF